MPSVHLLRRNRQALLRTRDALCVGDAQGHADWHFNGCSEQWREALEALAARPSDLLICDLRLLDGPASNLLRRLPRPLPRILLLTPTADDPLLFETLVSGAHAYWLDRGLAGLKTAVSALLARQASISPALSRQLLQAFGLERSGLQQAHCVAACHDHRPTEAGLSVTQQYLLSLFAHGLLEREIAQRWQIGIAEIGQRVADLYEALHRHAPRSSGLPAVAPA